MAKSFLARLTEAEKRALVDPRPWKMVINFIDPDGYPWFYLEPEERFVDNGDGTITLTLKKADL